MTEQLSTDTLARERDDTLAEIRRLEQFLVVQLDEAEDEVDSNIVEREKTLALIQNLERKVEELEYAMENAQKGKYGICESCGQPIDPERLALLPGATLCVKCKQAREKHRAW